MKGAEKRGWDRARLCVHLAEGFEAENAVRWEAGSRLQRDLMAYQGFGRW